MKKTLYLVLTLVLIFSLAVPTYAANGNSSGNGVGNSNASGQMDKDKVKDKEQLQEQLQEQDQDCDGDCDELMVQSRSRLNYGLPYGLAKRTMLPYGLAKREMLPFGLGKLYLGNQLMLGQASIEELIDVLEDLIAEGNDVYEEFDGSDYDDELDALEDAIDAAEDAVGEAEQAIEDEEDVDQTALLSAYHNLKAAISAFDDVEALDAQINDLEDRIDEIEEILDDVDFDEEQGAYPEDSDEDLVALIAEIEKAIDDGITYEEASEYSDELEDAFEAFGDSIYATESQIDRYMYNLDKYFAEAEAWADEYEINDVDASELEDEIDDYYKLVDRTTEYESDDLVSLYKLIMKLNTIVDARAELLDAVDEL